MTPKKTGQSEQNGIRVHDSSIEPGHSVQKRKQTDSDSQSSLKKPAAKKQRLNTLTARATDKENLSAYLPNEMLQMILEFVGTSDLLNCRQVNRQWNEISTEIIRGRDDITIHFGFTNGQFVQKFYHQHREEWWPSKSRLGSKTLKDIVNCIQDSDQFPFTNYGFDELSHLRKSYMRDFLKVFGKEIRSLEVRQIHSEETLRKLVFEKAPNLKILGIWYYACHENTKCVRNLVESTNQLQLPKLEVLRTNDVSSKIMEVIMMSSANLKSISLERSINTKDLQNLRRAGKLNCLKNVHFQVGEEIIARWLECGPIQLQFLNLTFPALSNDQKLSVTRAVEQLLQSIKNTLQSLTTEPFEFSTGLVLPRFEKLKRLCLVPSKQYYTWSQRSLLPLIDSEATFPNLKELDIHFRSTFRQLSKTLPTVETLRFKDGSRGDIEGVMKFTPNVTTLVIRKSSFLTSSRLVDFQAISTYLPKLKNLYWELRDCTTKDISRFPLPMHHFDITITGLPADLCKELAKKSQAKLCAAVFTEYYSNESQTSIPDLKELENLKSLSWTNHPWKLTTFFMIEDQHTMHKTVKPSLYIKEVEPIR